MLNADGSSVRLLFVERSEELLEIYQALFTVLGCVVKLVRTGEEAIVAVETYRPHAVYASLVLEGMSGLELATRLRELDVIRHAVLVALTGYAESDIEVRARDAGFDRYLLKPVDLHNLVSPLSGIPEFVANKAAAAVLQEAQRNRIPPDFRQLYI